MNQLDTIGNALIQLQADLSDLRDQQTDQDTIERIQRVIEALGAALDALREIPI